MKLLKIVAIQRIERWQRVRLRALQGVLSFSQLYWPVQRNIFDSIAPAGWPLQRFDP